MPKKNKKQMLEVCYKDLNGTSRRAICEELDRKATNGGSSVADAQKGDIWLLGTDVQFPPENLVWVRIYQP